MTRALCQLLVASSLFAACSKPSPTQAPPETPPAATTSPASEPAPSTDTPSASDAAAPKDGKMCGGIAGIACEPNQFCSFAPEAHCGAADMSGTCQPKPEMCTAQVDEVCGCDDKTYSNACMAAQAGVSVIQKGACAKLETIAEGKLCGTRGVNANCADGLYCAFKSDCGATDRGGVCTKKPSACTRIYRPVCGCDGVTYGSDCTAAAAGASVATQGACKPQ